MQLEFGFLLGPPDGRYLIRLRGHERAEAVLVLTTLGAPERRRLGGRRARALEEALAEPVPTARATVVRPDPFPSREAAEEWLGGLREDPAGLRAELDRALALLNRALRAQRAATADPYLAEVSAARALVARVGYGQGQSVADGRYGEALELPRATAARRSRRSMEAPEERFAALAGGREEPLVAEELVLRARADLNAGRPREAALQARIAIEALLAELEDQGVASHRESVRAAAAAALAPDAAPPPGGPELEAAVASMEAALRRHRLRG